MSLYEFVASEEALETFFLAWRAGTLPKSEWTHAAHVAVAACLAYEHGPEEALRLARSGIIAYNTAVGVANTKTHGYHETLTCFWSQVIGKFVRGGGFASRLDAVRAAVETFGGQRDLFKKYYSFDVVADRRARKEWVPPDR